MRRIGLVAALAILFSGCGEISSSPERDAGADDQLAYAIDGGGAIAVAEHDCSPLAFNVVSVSSTRPQPDGYGSIWQIGTDGEPITVDVLRLGEVPEGAEEVHPWAQPVVGDDILVLVGTRDGNTRMVSIRVEDGSVGALPCE